MFKKLKGIGKKTLKLGKTKRTVVVDLSFQRKQNV